MDAALMQFIAEAQPTALPRGTGKPAASQEGDGGGFGAMFQGLVAADQPQGGEAAKPAADIAADTAADTSAETQPATDTATGVIPGMWNFLPLMPMTAAPPQTTGRQTAKEAAGAIAPLTAVAGQVAIAQVKVPPGLVLTAAAAGQQSQTVPMAQTAEQQPVQTETQATAQQMPQTPATITSQTQQMPQMPQTPTTITSQTQQMPQMPQTPATIASQTPPDSPAAPQITADMPAAMPTDQATATVVKTAEQAVPTADAPPVTVQTAIAAPAATEPQVLTAAAPQTAVQQQEAAPAVTAQAAGWQRPLEKPAPAPVKAADTDAANPGQNRPQVATATVTASGEAQTAGDDGTALTGGSFAPAGQDSAPPPVATTANQAFAAFVDQAVNRQQVSDYSVAAGSGQTAAAGPDPNNVAGQIVDNARLITRAENSEMVIKLKPEHLGELTLKIVVDSGVVSATFHTSNADVRAAIEATLPQLRQDMANQGLKVDNVGVYTSLDQFFANDQQHAPQQQQQLTARRQGGEEKFADTAAAVASLGSQTATIAGGIDYRI